MEATPLTLALVADCKAKKGSDTAGDKAHRLLAEGGYVSTDLMSPLTKGSTCSDSQWAYFNAAFKASLTDSALKLYSYDTPKGLSDAQKVERRKIGKRFTHMTGNWKKGLARLEKAVAEADGTSVKASFETKVHEKLSTLLKQLEGKEQFNGDLTKLIVNIQTSLTHIKLK
tara:strand:- start:48 stop:560 length:513 start_codon:yes stop_codon:yes gene_type:complete